MKKTNRLKYRVTYTDYSKSDYGERRKLTVSAVSVQGALEELYAKHPKARCPSIELIPANAGR
jgi:hypothetical protein